MSDDIAKCSWTGYRSAQAGISGPDPEESYLGTTQPDVKIKNSAQSLRGLFILS